MKKEEFCRIRKTIRTEVAVAGGGTAGVFAAISAARAGAEVLLIEKNSRPGGTMTAAGVNFPGLFYAWGRQIIGGPCFEAIERTVALGGAVLPKISFRPVKHWHEQILLNPFVFQTVLMEMCRESGVRMLTGAVVADAMEQEDGFRLLVGSGEGLCEVDAKVAIDATGDASLAGLAGFERMRGETLQPATPQNHISGYELADVDRAVLERAFEAAELPEGITAKKLWNWLRDHKIDLHVPAPDADTPEGRAMLEEKALGSMLAVYRFFRTVPGLEKLTVDFLAAETGVRETCRIVGETVVSAEDYISGTFYEDSVCYAFYPIDLHVMKGIEQKFFEENVVAKVPYRALVPKGAQRLLVAGRCLSSDRYANSGLRVEAVCMATGQVAGAAAVCALRQEKPVLEMDLRELKKTLGELGAILPSPPTAADDPGFVLSPRR